MIVEVRAPQDEAKIVPNRLSESLSSDFGREKSIEKACREASRATRGAQVARGAVGASRGAQGARPLPSPNLLILLGILSVRASLSLSLTINLPMYLHALTT